MEVRTWQTSYRGDLLICSTNKKQYHTIPGHAQCVVTLADIVPMQRKHCKAACMAPKDFTEGKFAWILENVRIIRPFAVKGKLSLWECDHDIEYLPEPKTPEEDLQQWEEIFKPLFIL